MFDSWKTWANAVTLVRLVACVIVFSWANHTASMTWNLIGLAIYWVLDVADGFLARKLNQETRIGAQLDILADRVLVAFFYFNYAALYPGLLVPIILFLIQFMFIDHFLSNQFMRWRIKSPNYFFEVDRTIWRWNWSPLAKLINSAAVTGVLVLSKSAILGSIVCGSILVVKVWSAVRLARLRPPEQEWGVIQSDAPPASPPSSADAA